jgi:negative regulator of sigma E activity
LTPEEKLQQYLEDGILPEESDELSQLLEDDTLYEAYLQYERIDAELKALPRPKLSDDFTSRVMAALPEAKTRPVVTPIQDADKRLKPNRKPHSKRMAWFRKHPD